MGLTPAQEDFALRSCHPLYAEWCREDEDDGLDMEEELDEDYDYEEAFEDDEEDFLEEE